MRDYMQLFAGDAAPVQAAASAMRQDAGRYRILLVDDEPGVVKALIRVFRQENYEILAAASGEEALARLDEAAVHVVISDYMMPGMNGADLLKRIKARHPDTIRIMLTGHADTGAVMGAINEGAVYKFILKPWNDDDLRVTVALAIEQHDLIRRNRALQVENAKQSREISALARLAVSNRSQLGMMLFKKNMLTGAQLQELQRQQQNRKEPFIGLLLEKGWIAERDIRTLLRQELMFEEVSLAEIQVDAAMRDLIPRAFCEKQLVVPLRLDGHRLMLAVADPMDGGLIEDIRFTAGLDVQVVMADIDAIRKKLESIYGRNDGESDFRELETLVDNSDPYEGIEIVIDDDQSAPLDELLRETGAPPAIRLANAVILEAMRLKASDIHIQPRTKSVVVRYRIDGVLSDKIQIPHQLHQTLVSRLKIMAELDIAERRRPQDGRLTVRTALRTVDLRISTLPTINGEKVVMRLLDRNAAVHTLDSLGLSAGDLVRVRAMVARPQGIVLATGPTGSGKTTTLYSLLQSSATPEKNYITIEDPVEYYMDQAGQVLIKDKIGLSFPVVLRSILRQDPDVILVGEIRDVETAEVAFHAALTGHQVFSTLHTNSAVATIARLLDMGLKPFVLATALEGVIAQRLVRKICDGCRVEADVDPAALRRAGIAPGTMRSHRGAGCAACHGSGYQGRLGIYEVLRPDDAYRDLIMRNTPISELTRAAREMGLGSLYGDAREKIGAGLTTVDEVLRVLGPAADV
jgi:type II secretory ATPase GspE/PulE/Tfp pilus assembly ATPase PilB-like protein/DNA-binding NarL/FixJ family response regulator